MAGRAIGDAPIQVETSRVTSAGAARRRERIVLATLTFVYVLNFLDRQLLGILAKPIQDALRRHRRAARADRRALFRDVLLLHRDSGRLARRSHQPRRRCCRLACAIWSAATIACGMAAHLSAARRRADDGRLRRGGRRAAVLRDHHRHLSARHARGRRSASSISGPPIGAAMGVAFGAAIAAAFDWRDAVHRDRRGRHRHRASLVRFVVARARARRDRRRRRRRVGARRPSGRTLRMFFTNPVLMLAALGSGATQFVTYGLGNFAVLFLMREKGMTLGDVAIWYALVVGVGMGGGMIVSGRVIDRLTQRVARRSTRSRPALSLAVAMPFYVGFVWAPGWPLALALLDRRRCSSTISTSRASVALVQEEVRARPARAVGRAAAAGDELHRAGPRARPGSARRATGSPRAATRTALQLALYTLAPFYLVAIGCSCCSRAACPRGPTRRPHEASACSSPRASLPPRPALAAGPPIVDAPAGAVEGTTEGGVARVQGHSLRACRRSARCAGQPPVPLPRWTGVRARDRVRPRLRPAARPSGRSIYRRPAGADERGLPVAQRLGARRRAQKAPVLVWIHGGALVTGSSREPMYDGRRLARARRGRGVDQLPPRRARLPRAPGAERGDRRSGVSGNYGLLDQIAALRLGARQHRRVRRRSRQRHDRRRIRRRRSASCT